MECIFCLSINIFSGNILATAIMKHTVAPLKSLDVSLKIGSMDSPDINQWAEAGVPAVSLRTESDRYFWFHHSEGID